MDHLRQDIRYAVRRLFKSPAFTLVAIVTLGLGIGANSAIFSVVNGVLLKPLPYPESGRLVGVYHVSEGHRVVMSGPNFIDVMRAARSLESVAASDRSRKILTGEGEPTRLDVAEVSASLFSVLRVQPALGRVFNADENTPGRTHVVILSDGLWRQRFGSDPKVVGRHIQLDGESSEIIGVMPPGFSYPAGQQAWQPIAYDENFVSKQRASWYLGVVARLKPSVTPEQSAAEIQTIGRTLEKQYPDANGNVGMTTFPLQEAMVTNIRQAVLVLLGAVGFVLLIACANVANLLLARAAARESEMAVRTALGAGRSRLLRQLLTESVILSLCGAGVGLLFAIWGVAFLTSLQPDGIPRLEAVQVDGTVIAFTLGVAVLTGLIFGLIPALHATRGMSHSLKESGRGAVTSRAGARLRGTLVVIEMALGRDAARGRRSVAAKLRAPAGRRPGLPPGSDALVRADPAGLALPGRRETRRVLRSAAVRAARPPRGQLGGNGHGAAVDRHGLQHLLRDRGPAAAASGRPAGHGSSRRLPGLLRHHWYSLAAGAALLC